MDPREFLATAGIMLVDPRTAPATRGVIIYRRTDAGYQPIRWEYQRKGDVILRIDWERGVIQQMSHYRVLAEPDLSDTVAMPVRCVSVPLES